ALLFYGTTFWGGAISQIHSNAFALFEQNTLGQANDLESDMIHRWSELGKTAADINELFSAQAQAVGGSASLLQDETETENFLYNISGDLIALLRKNRVTGVFVALNGKSVPGGGEIRPGIYLRDIDPESTPGDRSDLSMERGSTNLYRRLGITTDIAWQPAFFYNGEPNSWHDTFALPVLAAQQALATELSDLGFWNPSFSLEHKKERMMTYSLPLLDKSGKVYGVLGVDVSEYYLKKQLHYQHLSKSNQGVYCLAMTEDGGKTFHKVFASGPAAPALLPEGNVLSLSPSRESEGFFVLDNAPAQTQVSVQYLTLYNTNTPFVTQQWALLGILRTEDLLSFTRSVNRSTMATSFLSVIAGILLTCFIASILVRPVNRLIEQLRGSNPRKPISLSKLQVTEIDELGNAIEDLSRTVSESSSMLSRIIEVTGLEVAAFETDTVTNHVAVTDKFFSLLGITPPAYEDLSYLTAERFTDIMKTFHPQVEETGEHWWSLRIISIGQPLRWVRLTLAAEGTRRIGSVVDTTDATISKHKIEYERDYDPLTNLLNRRAFVTTAHKLFEQPSKLKTAAMLMLDLDNLKFINDQYGHDCGDCYIQAAANALKKVPVQNLLLCRFSGDEFYAFFYGFVDKEMVRHLIDQMKQNLSNSFYTPPGNDPIRVRCSGGIAWYPDHSDDLELLSRYADFAMYTAKNTKKGDICEFSQLLYDQNSYMLHAREELNKLLEGNLVDYHFQPIVSAVTGELFAYEALMRSRLSSLKGPLEILSLARAQSKLYEIERMTLHCALRQAREDSSFDRGSFKLFVNSIANQMLSEADIATLVALFEEHRHRLVLEVTEEEQFSEDFTIRKRQLLHSWNSQIALDDFGAGYNSDTALLVLTPDYVKIDMSIVRDIDSDPSKQDILRNLISYSHERGIRVIAEGVETPAELQTLVGLSVDLLQGYYIGHPKRQMELPPQRLTDEICAAQQALLPATAAST
ncbi:MAG: EAL domain-containing protein, partial [Angelakisella sp.]